VLSILLDFVYLDFLLIFCGSHKFHWFSIGFQGNPLWLIASASMRAVQDGCIDAENPYQNWPLISLGILFLTRHLLSGTVSRQTFYSVILTLSSGNIWKHFCSLPPDWPSSSTSVAPHMALYTVFHKKTSASYFNHFSLKCWRILIILSLLHSQMNCRKICNKVYHLTSNLLPHYLVKTECSIVQIYSTVFNASVMQNR